MTGAHAIRTLGIVLATSAATGCLGGTLLPSSGGTTRVESTPSGAVVIVMGQRIGTTPVDVPDRLVFPVAYPAEQAGLYGRVVLEHPGCETAVRTVDLEAANTGMKVELVCEDATPGSPSPSPAPDESAIEI